MSDDPVPDALSRAILRLLADAPQGGAVSLPWLGKQLGLSASVLMRQLTRMGSAVLGTVPGPGWVRVAQSDQRWLVHIEPAGRAQADREAPASQDVP